MYNIHTDERYDYRGYIHELYNNSFACVQIGLVDLHEIIKMLVHE